MEGFHTHDVCCSRGQAAAREERAQVTSLEVRVQEHVDADRHARKRRLIFCILMKLRDKLRDESELSILGHYATTKPPTPE